MPWLALPYLTPSQQGQIFSLFKLKGIPTLLIIGPDGVVITEHGRMGVVSDPFGAKFPWKDTPDPAVGQFYMQVSEYLPTLSAV
jgi:nucleoredoxin